MITRLRTTSTAARVFAALALVAALGICVALFRDDDDSTARASAGATFKDESCPETVLSTLGSVLERVYREGVSSERTASAQHLIERSLPLRKAIEESSPSAARAATRELLATGHMTNIQVTHAGRTLVSVGGPALAPLRGTIKNAAGTTIATYLASVWANSGFASETSGLAEGLLALRTGNHSIGGSLSLPDGALPPRGTLTRNSVTYQYTSFAAQTYPSGNVSIYLLKPLTAALALCGTHPEDTVVNTLSHVAQLIYEGEAGSRTLVQVHRVEHDQALLLAVAQHNPVATRSAIASLLNHHIVRLRVSDTSHLLSDLGGPYVLAPVSARLRLHGHTIGSFVLSIQDDEGYLRLAHRLAGLDVLMYMNSPHPGSKTRELVKNSLGPNPGSPPAAGPYTYHGRSYRVITVQNAEAFPSGPLTIRVLIPIPYS